MMLLDLKSQHFFVFLSFLQLGSSVQAYPFFFFVALLAFQIEKKKNFSEQITAYVRTPKYSSQDRTGQAHL